MKPLILDLYCGGGGAGMGYYRAGFEVVGVDIHPQPHYPFWFHRRDALEFIAKHGHEFDAIHASPPCQRYTSGKALHGRETDHVDLVAKTRAALRQSGKPFIIENVAGSPLFGNLMLCGSMFGLGYEQLGLRRHRIFECVGFEVGLAPFACNHARWTISIFGDHIMGGAEQMSYIAEERKIQKLDTILCSHPGCERKANCIHHILPISDGGENVPENRTALCFHCHHKAHAAYQDWVRWGRKGGKKTASNPANYKSNLYQYWSKERKEAHRLAKLEALPF